MVTRRDFLAWAAPVALALSGCGWTPLYADRGTAPADAALRAIRVAPIPNRIGQKLEMALRDALNPSGEPTPQRYTLLTTLLESLLDLGIQEQGLATLGRIDETATFMLTDLRTGKQVLTDTAHVSQYFDLQANGYASVVAEDDARKRAVEELRDDIVTQLTLFLQHQATHPAANTGTKPAAKPAAAR